MVAHNLLDLIALNQGFNYERTGLKWGTERA